jgi:L-lactate permease
MSDIFIVKWIFAFSPILTVLVLMIFRNWSGSRAGAACWFVALIAAALFLAPTPS